MPINTNAQLHSARNLVGKPKDRNITKAVFREIATATQHTLLLCKCMNHQEIAPRNVIANDKRILLPRNIMIISRERNVGMPKVLCFRSIEELKYDEEILNTTPDKVCQVRVDVVHPTWVEEVDLHGMSAGETSGNKRG